MHELESMTGVMDAVTTSAQQAGATRVLKVSLSVGEMTEAIEDALMFAFEALSEGTLCEDAELQITMVKPKSRCLECGADHFEGVMLLIGYGTPRKCVPPPSAGCDLL